MFIYGGRNIVVQDSQMSNNTAVGSGIPGSQTSSYGAFLAINEARSVQLNRLNIFGNQARCSGEPKNCRSLGVIMVMIVDGFKIHDSEIKHNKVETLLMKTTSNQIFAHGIIQVLHTNIVPFIFLHCICSFRMVKVYLFRQAEYIPIQLYVILQAVQQPE